MRGAQHFIVWKARTDCPMEQIPGAARNFSANIVIHFDAETQSIGLLADAESRGFLCGGHLPTSVLNGLQHFTTTMKHESQFIKREMRSQKKPVIVRWNRVGGEAEVLNRHPFYARFAQVRLFLHAFQHGPGAFINAQVRTHGNPSKWSTHESNSSCCDSCIKIPSDIIHLIFDIS